jgi:hypothetical protein
MSDNTLEAIRKVLARIDRAYADDADKWEADRSLALEDIENTLRKALDDAEGHR